jgi:hypothetical protein
VQDPDSYIEWILKLLYVSWLHLFAHSPWAVLKVVATQKSSFEKLLEASSPSFPFLKVVAAAWLVSGWKARGIARSELPVTIWTGVAPLVFPAIAWVTSSLEVASQEREARIGPVADAAQWGGVGYERSQKPGFDFCSLNSVR